MVRYISAFKAKNLRTLASKSLENVSKLNARSENDPNPKDLKSGIRIRNELNRLKSGIQNQARKRKRI